MHSPLNPSRRYLPSATVAFIDEIFKANSAILNSLLTIINERLFDNGSAREHVPLQCLVCEEGNNSIRFESRIEFIVTVWHTT